jgi:hypothetical protein
MTLSLLDVAPSRRPENIIYAQAGRNRLFTNVEMIFNDVLTPPINAAGFNSFMLVCTVTSACNLTFIGTRLDPRNFNQLPANPHAVNIITPAGAAVFVWSWGAYTTLGGGPNQDTTMMTWDWFLVEATDTSGGTLDTFMTLDLIAGKR